MKTFIIIIIFLFHFLIPIKSRNVIVENNFSTTIIDNGLGEMYVKLGTATNEMSENEIISVTVTVFKKEVNSQTQKSFRNYDENLFRYNIVCVSKSTYNGKLTSTWLYGFWVKINGVLITKPIYPNGKDVMVYTTPTIVHYIETHEENIKINVGWTESIYEPKIIK